jgi:dihydrofolate reductase
MRRVQYYVATTLDGYIAHQDGTVDGFIGEGELLDDYLSYQKQVDAVLMGRKTYEFGLQYGVTNPYPHLKQYVISKSLQQSPDPNVELVSDGIALVKRLKSEPGRDLWLCGAGEFAASLCREELIDELIIKLNPVLFGSGISMIVGEHPMLRLELLGCKPYQSGVVLLTYRIKYR